MPREPPSAERALSSQTLTYEIILTLGQAFEVAYQLALQAQRVRPVGASAAEPIETKSSKPVPKPRVGVRKSAVRAPGPGSGSPTLSCPSGKGPSVRLPPPVPPRLHGRGPLTSPCLSALLCTPGAAAP